MKIAENQVSINYLTQSKERDSGTSNRYGMHKFMVSKKDVKERLLKFLQPQEYYYLRSNRGAPETIKEQRMISKTFVPYLNERDEIGHIISQSSQKRRQRSRNLKRKEIPLTNFKTVQVNMAPSKLDLSSKMHSQSYIGPTIEEEGDEYQDQEFASSTLRVQPRQAQTLANDLVEKQIDRPRSLLRGGLNALLQLQRGRKLGEILSGGSSRNLSLPQLTGVTSKRTTADVTHQQSSNSLAPIGVSQNLLYDKFPKIDNNPMMANTRMVLIRSQEQIEKVDMGDSLFITEQPYQCSQEVAEPLEKCKVDYKFGLVQHHRNFNKPSKSIFQNNQTHDLLRGNVNRFQINKGLATPSPCKYSLLAQQQNQKLKFKNNTPIQFSKERCQRGDFLNNKGAKESQNGYHHQVGLHNYSSLDETLAYSFGKGSHRDKYSYNKDTAGILNRMEEDKKQNQIRKRCAFALKLYQQEETEKRNNTNVSQKTLPLSVLTRKNITGRLTNLAVIP